MAVCWRCNEPVEGLLCVGCNALQAPDATPDFFKMLGLEPRYHLDLSLVEERYRGLAKKLHPDRFAGKSFKERQAALQWTAHLNEARRVLKDSELRAHYLATGQAQFIDSGGPKLDAAFLEEILEWREADEEVPGAFTRMAEVRLQETESQLEQLFTAWEKGSGDLSEVEGCLARLKYLKNRN
jgi:molecular chaperone HscB